MVAVDHERLDTSVSEPGKSISESKLCPYRAVCAIVDVTCDDEEVSACFQAKVDQVLKGFVGSLSETGRDAAVERMLLDRVLAMYAPDSGEFIPEPVEPSLLPRSAVGPRD